MRIVIRAALAAVLVLTVGVGSVAAHECYVVNRSAQGNAGASHSQRWFTLTLEQLFSETEEFGLPDLTAGQVDWAVATPRPRASRRRSRSGPTRSSVRARPPSGGSATAATGRVSTTSSTATATP